MLKIKKLSKTYQPKNGYEVVALDSATIDFGDKGLVFLLGKSGSGKSTMLNLIGGLDAPTSGEVIVNGRSSKTFKEADYDSYRNTHVGFVFQEYNLIDSYSVGENVGIALELLGKEVTVEAIDEILRMVDLVDGGGNTLRNRLTNELSGGQKQRVAIARALVKNPDIILADEPTGALDSQTGAQLFELLKEISKEKLVIVVTHDEENANKYGDRIIELADGEIVRDTLPEPDYEEHEKRPFIKSKLPFKRAFTLGLSALRVKTGRLVVSMILSIVAFALFGSALTISATNEYAAELRMMYDADYTMIFLQCIKNGDVNDEGYKLIKEYNAPRSLVKAAYTEIYYANYFAQAYYGFGPVYENKQSSFMIGVNPTTGERDAKLSPDPRFSDPNLCRLPQDETEIAITDHMLDMFMIYNYIDRSQTINDGRENQGDIIYRPDDMIGRTIDGKTIVGVYSTEIDLEEFRKYDIGSYNDAFLNIFATGLRNSVLSSVIVHESVIDDGYSSQVYLVGLSGDINTDLQLINKLREIEGRTRSPFSMTWETSYFSPFSNFVSWIPFFREFMQTPLIVVSTVFAIFSALMLINFLSVSISAKKKELGILRALGARKIDLTAICLIESFLIAIVEFIVSVAIVLFVVLQINLSISLPLVFLGIPEFAALVLLIFGVAALATIFPVRFITRKKPVDIINDK